ncbi:unnamed protein product, partial [Iphiclides podalirius]
MWAVERLKEATTTRATPEFLVLETTAQNAARRAQPFSLKVELREAQERNATEEDRLLDRRITVQLNLNTFELQQTFWTARFQEIN